MAKKKKKSNGGPAQKAPLSPQNFIRKCVHTLPIDKCYRVSHPGNEHTFVLFILRRETSGELAMGSFLVDSWCRGVYDTSAYCHLSEEDFENILDPYRDNESIIEEIPYAEAHNFILGAIEFAEEAGIKPHKDFKLTQVFLEDDTDDIPLIEYEFGRNDKYVLDCSSLYEFNTNLAILEKNLSPDQYELIEPWDALDEDYDDDDDDDDEDSSQYDDSPYPFIQTARRLMFNPESFKDFEPVAQSFAFTVYVVSITTYLEKEDLPTPHELEKFLNSFRALSSVKDEEVDEVLQNIADGFTKMLRDVRKKYVMNIEKEEPLTFSYYVMIAIILSVFTEVEHSDPNEIEKCCADAEAFVELTTRAVNAVIADLETFFESTNRSTLLPDED